MIESNISNKLTNIIIQNNNQFQQFAEKVAFQSSTIYCLFQSLALSFDLVICIIDDGRGGRICSHWPYLSENQSVAPPPLLLDHVSYLYIFSHSYAKQTDNRDRTRLFTRCCIGYLTSLLKSVVVVAQQCIHSSGLLHMISVQ